MPNTRVLIAGANGLLGQALVDRLHNSPRYNFLATSRDQHSFHPVQPSHAVLDICDTEEVERLLTSFDPTVFVNCAAMTQVDRCETQHEACWAVNADAVENLAVLCHRTNTHLVHVSTDFVFNGKKGPYVEDDQPDPVNFYGESKLAGERAIRDSTLDEWSIARTVLVYGTGHRLKRSNIVLWLIDELSSGNSVQIVTDQWRTPTYAPDLAQGIQRIIDKRPRGIYHISGAELVSVFQFARRVAACFGYDTSLVEPTTSAALNQTARRPPQTGFLIEKARSELAFQPHSIESALKDLGMVLDLQSPA